MKKKIIGFVTSAMLASSLLVACGGTSQSTAPELLAQTGCAGASCYGYNVASPSSLQFYVNAASWADLHYTVNGGGQSNVRMTASGGNNSYTVSGLKSGDVVRYFFTIANGSGGASDTAWLQYTMGGTTPTTPTGPVKLYNDCNYGGWSAGFDVGSYKLADLVAHGAVNDQASSIRVPAGYKITLYKDDNFAGTAVTVTGDNSCLTGVNFNDLTTSIVVSTNTTSPPGWTLAWQDEFNGTSLDTSKWSYEVNGTGGGNNELQYYTSRPENVRVSGGNLIIEARKETYTGPDGTRQYTSGRINTKGKANWAYGRMESRIKVPKGQGIWPAFWMLGANIDSVGWPKCGEIDNMETVNNDLKNYGTIHWADVNGNHAQYGNPSGNLDSSQYHVYAVEWDTAAIRWYVDGVKYNEANILNNVNNTGAFHNPFFLIYNMAVGGQWPGNPDASTVFPKQLLVDYVRVYRK